jgi:cytochrome c556
LFTDMTGVSRDRASKFSSWHAKNSLGRLGFPKVQTEGTGMKKLFAGIAAVAILVAGAAYADAIADRKAVMKANGGAAGTLAKSVKGEMDYDAAAVMTALQTINDGAKKLGDLFPAGSETGDTKASPKIWENMDGFKAAIAKLVSTTDAAIAAAPKNKEELATVFGPIGGACGECHQNFRLQ